jgi:hypothetical protein
MNTNQGVFSRSFATVVLICVDLRLTWSCQLLIASYCTVRFTMLVAVAPPLALLAVTVTAEVPAGVPGLCGGAGVFMLTPHPASTNNAVTHIPAANLNLSFLVCVRPRTNAIVPRSASSAA